MTFNKYCALTKLKDGIKQELDDMERAKNCYLKDYEIKRKAHWRKYYKLRDEAGRVEQEMAEQKSVAAYDPDLERKLKAELLGSE